MTLGQSAAGTELVLLSLGSDLQPQDAVAAVLVLEDGRYVMQLRDAIPGVFYPGHWGCFGGAVEQGEEPAAALRRELREELELEVRCAEHFTEFVFDFSPLGYSKAYRIFFEVLVSSAEFARVVIHEGAAVKAFEGAELLACEKVTPYDAFAIWMHMRKKRIEAAQ